MPQAVYIDYPPALQLKSKAEGTATANSASPCCWVLIEEAETVQVRCSAGTSPPLCWHIPDETASYDARDQATIEIWEYDELTKREGVKHITRLCSEAVATAGGEAATTKATAGGQDADDSTQPTNGSSGVSGPPPTSVVTPPPLLRLLAVLRSLPESYTASDFAYTPLLTNLEMLMRAPLLRAQLQEVAKVLVDRGLGQQCPVLVSTAAAAAAAATTPAAAAGTPAGTPGGGGLAPRSTAAPSTGALEASVAPMEVSTVASRDPDSAPIVFGPFSSPGHFYSSRW
jgi:hypothetical protein